MWLYGTCSTQRGLRNTEVGFSMLFSIAVAIHSSSFSYVLTFHPIKRIKKRVGGWFGGWLRPMKILYFSHLYYVKWMKLYFFFVLSISGATIGWQGWQNATGPRPTKVPAQEAASQEYFFNIVSTWVYFTWNVFFKFCLKSMKVRPLKTKIQFQINR